MKVCEQLSKMFRGREITSLSSYYEIKEFMLDGQVLLYDNLLDQFIFKDLREIATYELVEE